MTYEGEVRGGVVVIKDAPKLDEGTRVRVVVDRLCQEPQPGTLEALLSFRPGWAGDPAEVDRLLEEIQRDRDAWLTPLDDRE